ncbi:MAG: hypothetical protein WAS21_06470 [Geminicoccaceae bacterium]
MLSEWKRALAGDFAPASRGRHRPRAKQVDFVWCPRNSDHTLALLRRMDAKLDRLQADVIDLRGRLQRVEGRLTSVDVRLGVLGSFDGEVTRIDRRLDDHGGD